jgi:hypothetical protein
MPSERHPRPEPPERTFAALFPWRHMRRVVALIVLILAIVMIKRSLGRMLTRAGELWGGPRAASSAPVSPAAPLQSAPPAGPTPFGVHLGPGLAPPPRPPPTRPATP